VEESTEASAPPPKENLHQSTELNLRIASQYMDLGRALKHKGDCKGAATEMNKALALRRRAVGKDHPENASTYYQSGILYSQAQDYDNACSELKRALTLGRPRPRRYCLYVLLMGIVLNAIGNYDTRLRELKKALSIFEHTLGRDHDATARTLHHMGDSYSGNGDSIGALVQHGKAFVIQTVRLGR
jgi:tetratricopeptide (TPR) repeat protein